MLDVLWAAVTLGLPEGSEIKINVAHFWGILTIEQGFVNCRGLDRAPRHSV